MPATRQASLREGERQCRRVPVGETDGPDERVRLTQVVKPALQTEARPPDLRAPRADVVAGRHQASAVRRRCSYGSRCCAVGL